MPPRLWDIFFVYITLANQEEIMSYNVRKVSENIYSFAYSEENYFVVLNTLPFTDSDGTIKVKVELFKSSDEKWRIGFEAPFTFVFNQYIVAGINPNTYLLNTLNEEVKRKTGVDLSNQFNEITKLFLKV